MEPSDFHILCNREYGAVDGSSDSEELTGCGSVHSNRAGEFVAQTGGYSAYVPSPLPPSPAIEWTPELLDLLSRADRALGGLDGSIATLPNPDLFVLMYVRKEAVLSSQIEGTQSSLQDVLEAEASIFSPTHPKDVAEVVNYVAAMKHGLARLDEIPLSVRLIREIHEQLLRGVRGSHLTPGEIRKGQNWIGPSGSTLFDATFVPPPPNEVPVHLAALERFLHSDAPMPLLAKIGLAHAQFETIHPFNDGNGRVGRLLITFLLVEKRVLRKPVLYISHYFKRHREEYYNELQSIRTKGTWEQWLKYFLRGVEEVSQQASETARRILIMRERHREMITNNLAKSSALGHRLLEYLFDHPIVSVKEIETVTGAKYQAANNLVARLVALNILSELSHQKRNRRFMYHEYIRLFQEGTSNAEV